MSFLDRFKPQPRWKHADPAVRAAAVAEIPDDDGAPRQCSSELASLDDDVRVRRAALARIGVVEDARPAGAVTEQDEDLRREIAERLVGIAIDAGETVTALRRSRSSGLEDPKQFATVAKSSPHDTVRTAALGRVHDVKALGSIARHATDPQTALEAVARIADPAELLNVALKTDHKDAGIAALERVAELTADPATLATPSTAWRRARRTSRSANARAR